MNRIMLEGVSFTSDELARITNGTLIKNKGEIITSVSTDSRDCTDGTLFVAIKGERFDGHDFIKQTMDAGAVCALCERIPEGADLLSGDLVIVKDSIIALGKLAKEYLEKLSPRVVAVTGSVGKTTTKEFIYSVLSERFCSHKTEGNFNNELGLPLTVLSMKKETRTAVLEMGMSFKGEISLIVGTNTNGKVVHVILLSASETPGVGTKATDSSYLGNFVQKTSGNISDVSTITGATISSRAVRQGVLSAVTTVDAIIKGGK